MNLETKITIYKFTPQVFTLTQNRLPCYMATNKITPEDYGQDSRSVRWMWTMICGMNAEHLYRHSHE